MDTPWPEFQAFLNFVWVGVQSTGRIWEITDALGASLALKLDFRNWLRRFQPQRMPGLSDQVPVLTSIQLLLIGLPRLQP